MHPLHPVGERHGQSSGQGSSRERPSTVRLALAARPTRTSSHGLAGERPGRARTPGPTWVPILAMCAVMWLLACVWGVDARADTNDAFPPLRVVEVTVRLTVHRGGERMPTGARVAHRHAIVEGVAEYRLSRPARAGETIELLDFTAAISKEPKQLDEILLSTYADGPFDVGRLETKGAWDTTSVDHRDNHLVVEPRPGTHTFTLAYRVKVPHRYWPFGCIRRRCSLSGAIAPLPSVPVVGGSSPPTRGRIPAPVSWRVEDMRFASVPTWAPGTRPTMAELEALHGEELVVIEDGQARQAYPSVFWGPRWRRTHTIHHGVDVEVLHMFPRPGDQVPRERTLQLYPDVAGHLQRIAVEAVQLLEIAGIPLAPDSRVHVVQAPLRSSIAEFHPGVVLVSDQTLELFPAKRFTRFHYVAIARAVLEELLQRKFQGMHNPATDLWLAGAIAFALLEQWQRLHEHPDEFARDILRRFTFVPAVDRFLYTGQASFSQAYFRGSEDVFPIRNHPLYFAHDLPAGRRIHEKLVDLFAPVQLERFYRDMLAHPARDPIRTAEVAYGRELRWFFDQWLGPHPRIDYAITDVRSRATSNGWDHEITISQDGDRPIVQPVQVMAVERGGRKHYLVWNGELEPPNDRIEQVPQRGRHTFRLHTAQRLKTVLLDPRSRLHETPMPPQDNVDPLFNNRDPPAPRFLYTGIGLTFAASEFVRANTLGARFNALSGFAYFEASLQRDLRRTGHINVFRDRETPVGVSGGTNFWFGPKVNRQRRRARVRWFGTVALLNDRSLDSRGGLRLSESVSLSDDTRAFYMWPEKGRSLGLSVSASQVIRVDEQQRDHRYGLSFAAYWIQLWRLAHDHVLATNLEMELLVPLASKPEFRSLARVGGIGGLSGYIADEAFGLGVTSAQVEYRHVFVNNLRANAFHIAWLRSLGGALFAGASTTSHCDDYGGWFGPGSYYAQVGYGLLGYFQALGVTPQLVRLDLAVPLVRYTGIRCLGEVLPDHLADVQGARDASGLLPPFNVSLIFNQVF